MVTTPAITAIAEEMRQASNADKTFPCSTCSFCTIEPYDAPPDDNEIDRRMMRDVLGFVKGHFICSLRDVQLDAEGSGKHFCYSGNRDRQSCCKKCIYAISKLVKIIPRSSMNKRAEQQNVDINSCTITRQIYTCINGNSPEHFHNKYLSSYLCCNQFKPRDVNEKDR